MTDEESSKLLDASRKARSKKFYYYVLTLLHTGMRASDAAGLHWNQVNLKERVIFLPNTENKDTRWVPLTKELTEELSSLKKIRKGKDENLVFLKDNQLETNRAKARPGIKFREAFNAAKKELKCREKSSEKTFSISTMTSLLVNPYFSVKRDMVSCMVPSRRFP